MKMSELAFQIRLRGARAIHRAKASHIGGVFSMADIVACLYGSFVEPEKSEESSIILSKGHCCVAIYAALNTLGYIADELMDTYGEDGSVLMAHISHRVPYVEFSTGSLGHGLPFGVGKAFAAKREGVEKRVYVILSDGELDEGSNWEAMMFASHHRLENLTILIDHNKLQSLDTTENTIALEPLVAKFAAFNCETYRCNGHDENELRRLIGLGRSGKPVVIVCDTVKGYPIDFMENKVEWHYKPPSKAELKEIESQLKGYLS